MHQDPAPALQLETSTAPLLLSDGATGLRDLNDFDGSDSNDLLAVDNIGDDADINLGEGDDVLISPR